MAFESLSFSLFLSAFMVLLDQQESYLLCLSSLGVGGVSVTCIPSVLTNTQATCLLCYGS